MKSKIAAAVCAALMLAGCQTVQPPATASGKPEVTIKGSVAAIKAQILSRAMDRRFSVTKDTEYLLQVEKPSENLGAAILLGSKYDSIPAERIVFTFAPMADQVRVVAASMYVTNPGSSFERITPVDAGEGINKTQEALYEIKRQVETSALPPPISSSKPVKPAAKPVRLAPAS